MEFRNTVTDQEMQILRHKHVDPKEWLKRILRGEINRVKEQIKQQAVNRIINDPDITVMPGDIEALIEAEFNDPDYKEAAQRGVL